MKKIKKLLQTNEHNKVSVQIQLKPKKSTINYYSQTQQSCQNQQNMKLTCRVCQKCLENQKLITKYLDLIKLLKTKVNKLQKQHKETKIRKQQDQFEDFKDFNMQLESASIVTLKNANQRIVPQISQLQKEKGLIQSEIIFDKTVKKSQKMIKQKINDRKSFKKFISQLKILEEQFKDHKQNNSKTQKQCKSKESEPKINSSENHFSKQMFGKSISFIQLIQRSNISLKTSNNIWLNQNMKEKTNVSSIKCLFPPLSENQPHNDDEGFLKTQSNQNFKISENKWKEMYIKSQILEGRIINLSQTIMDLKSFLLHIRHLIYQLIKGINVQRLKAKQSSAFYLLNIIIKIFEYSEDQMHEMFQERHGTSTKSKLKQIFYSVLRG